MMTVKVADDDKSPTRETFAASLTATILRGKYRQWAVSLFITALQWIGPGTIKRKSQVWNMGLLLPVPPNPNTWHKPSIGICVSA